MARLSHVSVEEAIRALAELDYTTQAASAFESFLIAKRLDTMGIARTMPNVNLVVEEVFTIFPGLHQGRIQPFRRVRQAPHLTPTWATTDNSGRKTVWDQTTRAPKAALSLFTIGIVSPTRTSADFRNGLLPNAANLLAAIVANDGKNLPAREALAVLLLRDVDVTSAGWPDLEAALGARFGLSAAEIQTITRVTAHPAPTITPPAWDPANLDPALAPNALNEAAQPAVAAVATPIAPPSSLADLATDFARFLVERGLVFTPVEQIDLLASALGSQLLLFAGPSGSGKSTAARVLSEFFALPERRSRFEIGRGMTRTEEFAGYFSYLASEDGTFLETPNTQRLLPLDISNGAGVPTMIIEEANLSSIEGYLGPLVHGLSSTAEESVIFPLHAQANDVAATSGVPIPPTIELGPWVRVLATINVDSTAPAPANKVAGRACVVLLEAPDLALALEASGSLFAMPPIDVSPGSGTIGDPRSGLVMATVCRLHKRLRDALEGIAQSLLDALGSNVLTARDANRCYMFMANFIALAESIGFTPPDADALAAEQAILHFVLPGLSGRDFERALSMFEAGTHAEGLLGRRVERLLNHADAFGPPPDFWSALT